MTTSALLLAGLPAFAQDAPDAINTAEDMVFLGDDGEVIVLDPIIVQAASDELKQAPGSSLITGEDLQRRPVSNDVSEAVRRMPGANLTGNTTTGQRGNNRQIDLRGMGPENTLILVDGRPVLSRNSVRMGRSGERDTRGDSNWVPAEAIDRIEVIRGPAAARYGSGSAGGVVNIITKRPDKPTTTVSLYGEVKQDSDEGNTFRTNVLTSGPLSERLSYRTYLSYNQTAGDSPDINAEATDENSGVAAGREGVKNVDFSNLFEYELDGANTLGFELSYSRQGNEYAGDALFQDIESVPTDLIGTETNVMQRTVLALIHEGSYSFGDSLSYIQYEHTDNSRLSEGASGGREGLIPGDAEFVTTLLNNVTAKTEWNLPSQFMGYNQTLTLGAEYRGEFMYDPSSVSGATTGGVDIPGTTTDPSQRDTRMNSHQIGLYAEDNILVGDRLTLTPGLRMDWHSEVGVNLSPSLNATYEATENLTIQAGVGRAFKAPNLYQLNPDYVYRTRGNGCPVAYPNLGGGCVILGNPDLTYETSVNAELGVNYQTDSGLNAGLTYFHNEYRDKIQASLEPEAVIGTTQVFRWVNIPRAMVEGLEGNLFVPINDRLGWSTNATVMINSVNRSTGQPLSLVPDYTINTELDYEVTDNWSLTIGATHYGETPSPRISVTNGEEVTNPRPRSPYTLVDVTTSYTYEPYDMTVTAGIKNIFDTRIYREGTSNKAGANTYNEPGRTFLVELTKTF
ncbi:FepA family TonB-dependent siderophore receptor [Pseudooceanicola sp. HF7]|uniref:FepA family TonB-dependent siderophore receptor n=1 Tax=Pseudooceanicola sp. HF7 TaxID=2721560 RepID=UPI0014318161|nr:FepA family TonB-dependent siderophore receptor [Pseudooceanicola sp. HF7]NIZ10890.1 FepA family TonB-dependent siderophore receptor [Pseudooceanicola sp. HF7]